MNDFSDSKVPLTRNDAQAIRTQVATCAFLHLPRIAREWGIPVDRVVNIAGKLLDHRR